MRLFFLIFFVACLVTNANTNNIEQIQKIVASTRTAADWYGNDVAVYGDYAVVGVGYSDTDPGDDNGAAFVYKRNSNNQWVEIKRLVPSDQQSYGYENFGSSVDIYEDYIIVGSVYTATYFGGVYVYKKDAGGFDNWGEIKKLEGADANFNDFFGDDGISIYEDYIVVGATSNDYDENDLNFLTGAGAAYIFKKNQGGTDNWGQIKKIVASDRVASSFFGTSVDVYGEYVVVSANFEMRDANGLNSLNESGAVYIYKMNQGGADNWGEIKKIVPGDRAIGDRFGERVSIYDDYLVVGSAYDDEDASGLNTIAQSGSAYIFKQSQGGTDNWGQFKKLTSIHREEESYYGFSVAINGDFIVIGEPWSSTDANGTNLLNAAGAAYIYRKNQGGNDNWGLIKKLVHSDRNANDAFGSNLDINGDYILILAENQDYDENGLNFLNNAGAGYVFQLNPLLGTTAISNIYDKSAVSGGAIEYYTNLPVSSKGLVWSTSSNPTIVLSTKTQIDSTTSSFASTMTSLLPRTLYYARAYVTKSNGVTSYGNEISFTTKETIIIDGNQDGIDDTLQINVNTFFDANTNTYVTIELANQDTLYNVENVSGNESEFSYPFGLIGFKIKASIATVKLYFHGYPNLNAYTYRKILPNGKHFDFKNVAFSTENILGEQTAVATLTLIDGGIGDYDGVVNGIIYDPGGPAIFVGALIPTFSEWVRIIALCGFVLCGTWWVRKVV